MIYSAWIFQHAAHKMPPEYLVFIMKSLQKNVQFWRPQTSVFFEVSHPRLRCHNAYQWFRFNINLANLNCFNPHLTFSPPSPSSLSISPSPCHAPPWVSHTCRCMVAFEPQTILSTPRPAFGLYLEVTFEAHLPSFCKKILKVKPVMNPSMKGTLTLLACIVLHYAG